MAPEKIEADGEGKETGRQTAGEERPAARPPVVAAAAALPYL